MFPQLAISLRLHFRNKLALLYSYLFPTIFLIAFWVLYRHDQVPLLRHMGELLTVTVLGGACFGLPTTMVSERERGVWRRYRLAPIPTQSLVVSTVIARYLLLIIAGLLQLGLAMALGMTWPRHPFELWLAFTCVAFAFLGLGLVIAMTADNVPAVQALGQCIFLPMLIIGGVAVRLESLPAWAQHLSAFFPGRYSVEALQACVTGNGLGDARFSVLALLVIGAAGCFAGAGMFRWDAQQRFVATQGKGWVAVALAAWVGLGLLAEARGRIGTPIPAASTDQPVSPPGGPLVPSSPPAPAPAVTAPPPAVADSKPLERPPAIAAPSAPVAQPTAPSTEAAAPPAARGAPSSWRAVTMEHIDRDLRFDRLPPDDGIVAPIAPEAEQPDTDVATQLDYMATTLHRWKPGQVADPVQRVRNLLVVAAVPDVFQMDPLERFAPWVVFEHLQQTIPRDELIKILYWIALHPTEGDDSAVDQLQALRLGNGPSDMVQTRERVALYGVKLLGRITGKIAAK